MIFSFLNKRFLFKLLSLFSVVRGYNIFFIVFAQLTSSIFIFSESKSYYSVLVDSNIWLIILSSICSISAGYIINNVYDSGKDLINRPLKTILEKEISGRTKLNGYILLNILTLFFAFLVSLKALLFFSLYILGILFYSIRISRYPFIGNFLSVALSIAPFFAITLYYKNFSSQILTHASFLFFVILIRELIKDLESLVGDLTMNYNTIPVKFGEKTTKAYISFYIITTCSISIWILINHSPSLVVYYYTLVIPFFIFFTYFLWKFNSKKHYILLHNSLKFLIIVGLFSIILQNL
jgi:4-hydroxybenzoate polyprenyltransferase